MTVKIGRDGSAKIYLAYALMCDNIAIAVLAYTIRNALLWHIRGGWSMSTGTLYVSSAMTLYASDAIAFCLFCELVILQGYSVRSQ